MTQDPSAALSVAMAYYQAWTGKDVDRAMTHVADDVVCDSPLGRIEGVLHRRAIEHVGFRDDRLPAGRLDLLFQIVKPLGAARDQHDFGAVFRQHLGKAHAKPTRCAGDQRDAAGDVEQF